MALQIQALYPTATPEKVRSQRRASSKDQEEAVEIETAQSPEAQPDHHPKGKPPETIEPVPVMNLEPQDIDHLLDELREYHAIYSPLFCRREQRERSEAYLNGLLLDIPNKSIEPMILALEGADSNAIRATQHLSRFKNSPSGRFQRRISPLSRVLKSPYTLSVKGRGVTKPS